MKTITNTIFVAVFVSLLFSCRQKKSQLQADVIKNLKLKQGDIIACGPAESEFGQVEFSLNCSQAVKEDFNLGVALLHSFEYDEAEKVFSGIISKEPECAMAYWGVAMCNYHQVWPSPPSPEELEKGDKAIKIAQTLSKAPALEKELINAIGLFYHNWQNDNHKVRSLRYLGAMQRVYDENKSNREVAIFYALTLIGTAEPTDKTYKQQRMAGSILQSIYPQQPNHPGIVHYIIHTYDYPSLASIALPAARKYASIAPSSAHAQHMPSHIFTRLGLWEESISSNLASVASAKCYAESAGIKGHWDEELHGLDYLVYAYLQKGDNQSAKQQVDYVERIKEVSSANFKVAYAYAAIPVRYFLENKNWKALAHMEQRPVGFPWSRFPWQAAIFHFGRLLGAANIGDEEKAIDELEQLQTIYDTLLAQKDDYKANQVLIQIKSGEAWILLMKNNHAEALEKMKQAADLEDKTEKSPLTPGEVIPARELLANMYLKMGKPEEALKNYEETLAGKPQRFNSLYGAAEAGKAAGSFDKAEYYYEMLLKSAGGRSDRIELTRANEFLIARKRRI